jgi:hypothetical protein
MRVSVEGDGGTRLVEDDDLGVFCAITENL